MLYTYNIILATKVNKRFFLLLMLENVLFYLFIRNRLRHNYTEYLGNKNHNEHHTCEYDIIDHYIKSLRKLFSKKISRHKPSLKWEGLRGQLILTTCT